MGPSAYLGDRSHFYVHVTDRDDPVLVALQNLEGSLDRLSRPDQPVWLGWSENAIVVLAKN
jgi:spermidine/putrescine transport system ATP-binding protein/putrescine transport system ATP-binding protein